MIAHSVTQIANGTRRFRCMFGQIQNAVRFSVPHRRRPRRLRRSSSIWTKSSRNRIMVQEMG